MAKKMLQYGVACVIASMVLTVTLGAVAQEVAKKDPTEEAAVETAATARVSTKPKAGQVFACPDLQNPDKITIDPMEQGKDGWFFRPSSDLQEEFAILDESAAYMARLDKALKARGTKLVFVSVPSRGMAGAAWLDKSEAAQSEYSPQEAIASYEARLGVINKLGVLAPDMLQSLSPEKFKDTSHFYFKRDHHWTTLGAQSAAQVVAEALKQDPNYKQQKIKQFESKQIAQNEMKHTIAMEIQRLCTGTIPAEPYPLYETTAKADDESALFGDEGSDNPSILIGSSYSANTNFNFDGFLMQYTGLDFANYAVSGGMLFNALISLTNNPEFEKMKPPYMVWEAPSIYDLKMDAAAAFRQAIPGTYGACGDDQAVATGSLTITAGNGGVVLQIPAEKQVHGIGYYLVLDSSSRALTKFTIELDYDDDDGEWFIVDRSEFFDNKGRFFLELSDEIESNLVKVSINGASNVTSTMSAKVCRAPQRAVTTPAAK